MTRWLVLSLLCLVGASVCSAENPTIWGKPVTKTATVTGNGTADTALWTPATGNRIVLMGCIISTSAAYKVELEVANVDVIPPMGFQSGGPVSIGFGTFPLWMGTADATLDYTVTNAGATASTSMVCSGYEEPV